MTNAGSQTMTAVKKKIVTLSQYVHNHTCFYLKIS